MKKLYDCFCEWAPFLISIPLVFCVFLDVALFSLIVIFIYVFSFVIVTFVIIDFLRIIFTKKDSSYIKKN